MKITTWRHFHHYQSNRKWFLCTAQPNRNDFYEQEEGIIWHRNMMPTISIHANVGPGVLGNAKTKEIYNKLAEYRQDLPTGYTIDLDGSAEKSVTAVQKLLMPMPIMLFAIMTILMFQLKRELPLCLWPYLQLRLDSSVLYWP